MLTDEEKREIRDSVRRSLESLRHPGETQDQPDDGERERERMAEAERIIAEETERYYREQGLVKHRSRSGRTMWCTPQEAEHYQHRHSPSYEARQGRRFHRQTALVWAAAILLALLSAAYLIQTEALGLIGSK